MEKIKKEEADIGFEVKKQNEIVNLIAVILSKRILEIRHDQGQETSRV